VTTDIKLPDRSVWCPERNSWVSTPALIQGWLDFGGTDAPDWLIRLREVK